MFRELDEIAKNVARSFCQRVASIEFDDAYQDAWVGILLAKRSYDPKRGGFAAYAQRAASRWVYGRTVRLCSPVSDSSSRTIADLLDVKRGAHDPDCYFATDPNPEEAVALAEFRARVQGACKAALPFDGPTLASVLRILSGRSSAAQEALETGLPVRRLYNATWKARRRLAASRQTCQCWEEWKR